MARKKRYSGAEAVLQIEWSLEESQSIEVAYNAALNGVKEAAEVLRIEEQKLDWIFSGIRSRHIVGDPIPENYSLDAIHRQEVAVGRAKKKLVKAQRRVGRAKGEINRWLTKAVKSGLEHAKDVDKAIINRFTRRQYVLSRLTF